MSSTASKLKYLFSVVYEDGTLFHQNEEDTSATTPGGSAFSDVKLNEVKEFYLEDGRDCYFGVDLSKGSFFARHYDGNWDNEFTVGDPGPKPYKLIFYRQHTHEFTIGLDELSHEIKYCVGYTDATGVDHIIYVE